MAVVGHDEARDPTPVREHLLRQVDDGGAGIGVLDDVGQQLAGGAEQEPVEPESALGLVQPSMTSCTSSRPRPAEVLGQVPQRRQQAGLLQDDRVQLREGRPQHPDGLAQRMVDPFGRDLVGRDVLEVLARGEDVLECTVVEVLGEGLALPLLDVDQLLHQPRAVGRQGADREDPVALERRDQDAPEPENGQQAGAQHERRPRLGGVVVRRRAGRQVGDDGQRETTPHTSGLSWAAAMTGRRKNPLTTTYAVQVCSAEVSATSVSELVARTSKIKASQMYGATSCGLLADEQADDHGPHQVTQHDDPTQCLPVAGRDQEQGRHEEGDECEPEHALDPGPAIEVLEEQVAHRTGAHVGDGAELRQQIAHSSRPRRMPSATAAARSETPSFS